MTKAPNKLFTFIITSLAAFPAWADVAPGPSCGCSATESLAHASPLGAGALAVGVGLALLLLPTSPRR